MKLFAVMLMLVGCAAFANAKYEITSGGWAVACNPPLKFTGNENKDACFARCQKNPNCVSAVVDNSAKKNTCALVDKSAKCGPKSAGGEPHTVIAKIDPVKYTAVENVDVSGNGLAMAGDLAGFGGPIAVNPEKCGKICGVLNGCNGYSYAEGMGHSPAVCLLKTFTTPVTVGKEAKCAPKNAAGGVTRTYFAKAEHAPKKKC